MTIDPFRLTIALVPIAAYLLLFGLVSLRRRPLLTSGGSDLATLGVAMSGLMFVGPLELFRPEAATTEFGNYIWAFMLAFYWLCLLLIALVSRPRLVVYNMSREEFHSVLAEVAARLDSDARWAGNNLTLPRLGVHLHLDSFDLLRNVSLDSSGGRQKLDGWRRLARELSVALRPVRVKPNLAAVTLLILAVTLLAICVVQMWAHPAPLAQGVREVFAY